MLSALFWNVMRKDLAAPLARAAAERGAAVVLAAECGGADAAVLAELRAATGADFVARSETRDRVRVFTRENGWRWRGVLGDETHPQFSIWAVELLESKILLIAAHLPSVLHSTKLDQALFASRLSHAIERAEAMQGHRRSVLVGDLNMNPFEEGVTKSLSAVMTMAIASRGERAVAGVRRPLFYHPMWGHFGDRTAGPPGTFYRTAGSEGQFWHTPDQVLLRPDLMDRLRDLVILDSVGGVELLTTRVRIPDKARFSDHMPIAFRLDVE